MSDKKQLSIFVEKDFANRIKELAEQENRTISNFLKVIIKKETKCN